MSKKNGSANSSVFFSFILIFVAVFIGGCSDSNEQLQFTEISPPAPLQENYNLSDTDSVPEGVTFDPVERAFYAGGFNDGSITRVDADGRETLFRAADNRVQFTGIKIDAESRRLWACARAVDGIDNQVWVFDLASKQVLMEFLLAALATNGSCNDLVLDKNGLAYVSDSLNPYIYQLDPQTETGRIFVTDPLLEDPTRIGLGSNGLVINEQQTALIVGRILPARLAHITLPNGDSVTEISLDGDALVAPDGLAMSGNDVYAISGNAVSRIRLDSDLLSGTVKAVPQDVSGLSTGTFAEGMLYAVKSEITNFIFQQPLDTPFRIFRIDLDEFDQ